MLVPSLQYSERRLADFGTNSRWGMMMVKIGGVLVNGTSNMARSAPRAHNLAAEMIPRKFVPNVVSSVHG